MKQIAVSLAALSFLASFVAGAQTIEVHRTTSDLHEGLAPQPKLHFSSPSSISSNSPVITVDDQQRFQQIDGFGASLTDSAAWLFAKKTPAAKTDAAFKSLFDRKDGIALGILRQPVGSSDLAVTFYSYDDLCQQAAKACTTPEGATDQKLEHFSLAHDEEYILPLLRKALALNPDLHVMITPWSAPGWMKTSGTMLGSTPDPAVSGAEAKPVPSSLRPEFYPAFADYLVRTVKGYEAAGVPIWALTMQNEPLFTPPTYSGMQVLPNEQAKFIGENLGPALAAAGLQPKIMAYDHNWDRPDYPETVLQDPKAGLLVAGTAWHHYGGDPTVMTANHEEFPQKDQWVTESSGGTWQTGNIFVEEATELIAVMRNWSRGYVLWALATDEKHGPVVGGCDTCRGLVTIDRSDPANVTVKPELDYYVLGQASKFVLPGAVRIASDEPAESKIKDVAFRNPDGTVVLYALNAGDASQDVHIAFKGKSADASIPAGAVTTFVWKP